MLLALSTAGHASPGACPTAAAAMRSACTASAVAVAVARVLPRMDHNQVFVRAEAFARFLHRGGGTDAQRVISVGIANEEVAIR